MAQIQILHSLRSNCLGAFVNKVRFYSKKKVERSVFISESKDIYTNLAVEDWIYRNINFTEKQILMLWQNDPCVVIGRHQNPWLEANISHLKSITQYGVKFARRNSGGGTVFHDVGNLNLTFFTRREDYNRRHNLELITKAIFTRFNVKLGISPREDICLGEYKVSGTASKLGRPNAYHHCTLLVNANKSDLSLALKKGDFEIETNASKSVKSKIMNLSEVNKSITVASLMEAVGREYLNDESAAFEVINPKEEFFPGLTKLRDDFFHWDWRYGKTPKFKISQSLTVPYGVINKSCEEISTVLNLMMLVENGIIKEVSLFIPPGLLDDVTGEINVPTDLKGQKFSEELLSKLVADKENFVRESLKQIFSNLASISFKQN